MSALTEIFNHLYAYLLSFLSLVLGTNGIVPDGPVGDICNDIILKMYSMFTEEQILHFLELKPILFLSIGIFACGAIIGLIHRLMR